MTFPSGLKPRTAGGPPNPRWYGLSILWGAVLTAVGAIGFIAVFPFIAGEPDPQDPTDYVDPTWFSVVGPILLASLIAGVLLLIAPALHRRVRRSR